MKNSIMVIIKILLVCCIALGAYKIGTPNYESKIWLDLQSPDGNYKITVFAVGKPIFHAPQNIEVNCRDFKKEGMNVIRYLFVQIDNGGKDLTKANYNIEWKEGGALLTFKGEKQKPITYIIEWDKVFQW